MELSPESHNAILAKQPDILQLCRSCRDAVVKYIQQFVTHLYSVICIFSRKGRYRRLNLLWAIQRHHICSKKDKKTFRRIMLKYPFCYFLAPSLSSQYCFTLLFYLIQLWHTSLALATKVIFLSSNICTGTDKALWVNIHSYVKAQFTWQILH